MDGTCGLAMSLSTKIKREDSRDSLLQQPVIFDCSLIAQLFAQYPSLPPFLPPSDVAASARRVRSSAQGPALGL